MSVSHGLNLFLELSTRMSLFCDACAIDAGSASVYPILQQLRYLTYLKCWHVDKPLLVNACA